MPFTIRIDESKNRLYLTLTGLMNDDEILIFLASLLASLERPQKKSLADA